jgi:chromosome segregation protein
VASEHERAVLREERAAAAARATLATARAAALAGVRGEDPDPRPATLRRAFREREAAHARAAALAARLDAHLRAVGAADSAALTAAVEAAGWEASDAVRSWRALVTLHPSLPDAELGAGAAVDPGAAFAAARASADDAERAAVAAERAARSAHEALARAEGGDPIDVAAAEVELAAAADEVVQLRFERDALALAAGELAVAVDAYRATHLRRLEATAGERLAGFAGMPGRRVRLDEGFRATVVEADGRPLAAAQLSQGARDQLALALRWAIADLMGDDVALPLVLDDPFLNWDADRSARVAEALRAMAAEGRQVWLLSHRAELGGWGTPVAWSDG